MFQTVKFNDDFKLQKGSRSESRDKLAGVARDRRYEAGTPGRAGGIIPSEL